MYLQKISTLWFFRFSGTISGAGTEKDTQIHIRTDTQMLLMVTIHDN